jgi:hypothetical protein
MITSLSGFSENETLRAVILKLRETALSWASELFQNQAGRVTLEEFTTLLKKRFNNLYKTEISLSQFLTAQPPVTREEFTSLLNTGTRLFEQSLMNTSALVQVLIGKCPDNIKGLLFQAMEQCKDWSSFIQRAEQVAWLAFPDKLLNRVSVSEKTKKPKPPRMKRWCELHGEGTHDTEYCKVLKLIKSKGWNKSKNVAAVHVAVPEEKALEEEEDSSIKTHFYSQCSISAVNPFFTSLELNGVKTRCLLDTGADISIIHKDVVPKETKRKSSAGVVVSACGTKLSINEVALNIVGTIKGVRIKFSPRITTKEPKYVILGADVLMRYPQLLFSVLPKTNIVHAISEDNTKLEQLLKKFDHIFKDKITAETVCNEFQHSIDTEDAKPIFCRQGRVPINFQKQVDEGISKDLEAEIIKESISPWNSRINPVSKPDGSLRLCIDYRPLNKVTVKNKYPLPRIDEILDTLNTAKFFSTLDATSGYYQIAMNPDDKAKTAFSWKNGHYEYNRMPFGLCNAPATFQRAMDTVLREELNRFVLAYLDDIIIFSKTKEEHLEHLETILSRLKNAGLVLNRKKCKFLCDEVKILGNIVSEGTVKPDPEKIRAIKEYPLPKTVKELRSFLGLINYCREFVPRFAEIAGYLSDLLKGETKQSIKKIKHTEKSIKAFSLLKQALTEKTRRAQPDFELDFILTTDASDTGIGAILTQIDAQGREHMISAFSKGFDVHQKNYSVTDKELLAVVKSIEKYRHYLIGKEFLLRTDHKALTYLWEAKNPTSRLLRWAMKLQEYKFRIEYIKGEDNAADGYSRVNTVRYQKATDSVLSVEMKTRILTDYHLNLGHGSAGNMKAIILSRYKWPGIFKDIDDLVANCLICKKAGTPVYSKKFKFIETERPNELWEIDLWGRLTDRGANKFIVVCINHHTKWVETRVIKNKTADEICLAVEELIIAKHGAPERILSDCGLEFNNKSISSLAARHGIQWLFSSPFHHQTTGAVERVIQTLTQKLKKLSEFGVKRWTSLVEQATRAVNLSYNRSIGTSPFVFVNKRLPELDVDKELSQPRVKVTFEELRNKRTKIRAKYKESFFKGRPVNRRLLEAGEKVLIFRKTQPKLDADWEEGFEIKERISEDAYLVQKNRKSIRVNKSHIRLE